MNIRYEHSTSNLRASEMMESLKLTEKPEIISFAYGLLAPELFPLDRLNEVIKEKGQVALQDASTDGYIPLRKIIFRGVFTGIELREDLDSTIIMEDDLKENVAYVPGASFFPNGGKKNFFRLNYSNMPEDKIVEGIKGLGKVLYKYYTK